MKAYRVTGLISGRTFESYYTGKTLADVIKENVNFWNHSNIESIKFDELSKEQLVFIIKEMM